MSSRPLAEKSRTEALREYQEAQDALTDAIRDGLYPSKLATVVYRFATGCMKLGAAKLTIEAALTTSVFDGKRGYYEESIRQSQSAWQDFLEVEKRIEQLRKGYGS